MSSGLFQRRGRLRDSDGRFYGARLNLEFVPRLRATAVRLALDDPLRRPYLFVWKLDGRFVNGAGEVVEAVIVRRHDRFREWPRGPSAELWSEPSNGQSRGWSELATLYRRLPRGGGAELLLLCWDCDRPKRFLYSWAKAGQARFRESAGWICRGCADLDFSSEGLSWYGRSLPLPEPWEPYIFNSLEAGRRFLLRHGAREAAKRIGD